MRDLINLIFDDNVHVYNACHAFTNSYIYTQKDKTFEISLKFLYVSLVFY
jgi:hypothetical protein